MSVVSPLTELEALTIMFSLLVFALFTLTGMLNEECAHSRELKRAAVILLLMELPFTGFELTFVIVAFVVFSLFSLASVCIQPQGEQPEKDVYEAKLSPLNRKQRVITKQAGKKP